MDWRELLRQQIESTIKVDYSYMRPSRKAHNYEYIMPGMKKGDMIDIAVAIDTSGSINDKMLADFIGEVAGIMEDFDSYRLHLFCFDTEVHNPQQYDSDNMEDVREYRLAGFGGTDFTSIFKYLKENEIQPERLVVFTDGMPFGSWGDEHYCDTLWIVHGHKVTAPFGTTVEYN
jgi:predicted metal-dependent peptidase